MAQPVFFISTCEFSGDMHGAVLIEALKKIDSQAEFYGIGGAKMAASGMELLADPTNQSTIGFIEVLKNIRKMRKLLDQIIIIWEKKRPDLVIWLDSGGFNLFLAKAAKERGIPVVCMFSPSAWAYAQERAVKLAERVSLLLAVLPFEADFYRKFGTKVTYIGHPLLDSVQTTCEPALMRQELGVSSEEKMVLLMPGSRWQEIQKLLPIMLATVRELNQSLQIKWVLPIAASLDKKWLESLVANAQVPITLVQGGVYDLMAAADAAVITSGTATLEAAILDLPMVVIYRINWLSSLIYRILEAEEHRGKPLLVGLPNLIMQRKVLPELLQAKLKHQNLTNELRKILEDEQESKRLRIELAKVRELIGPSGVMDRAAQLIFELLG